jgi:hypothetical protein
VSDFGRVFLMVKYTDITQNTYVQSWTVMEIMAREKCGLLAVPHIVPISYKLINVCPWVRCGVTSLPASDVSCTNAWKPKVNYDMLASCIVAEFTGFMSQVSLMLCTWLNIKETKYSWHFYYVFGNQQVCNSCQSFKLL